MTAATIKTGGRRANGSAHDTRRSNLRMYGQRNPAPSAHIWLVDRIDVRDDGTPRPHLKRRPLHCLPVYNLPQLEDERRRRRTAFGRKGVAPGNKGQKYRPQPLTDEEFIGLKPYFGRDAAGVRNWAFTALMFRTGLRVGCEASKLHRRDLSRGDSNVYIASGKNGWCGYVTVDEWTWSQLDPWLELRQRYPDGPLFCIVAGGGKGVRPISLSTYRLKLHQIAEAAGLEKALRPHGLRHSHACGLDLEGYSLAEIQARLRHRNAATTGMYLRGMPLNRMERRLRERHAPGYKPPTDLELAMAGDL